MAGYHEDPTEVVLEDVRLERVRQNKKWGEQNHTADRFYVILGEEFGEVGEAILDMDRPSDATRQQYRTELLHVAAVAVQMVENLDRDWKNK